MKRQPNFGLRETATAPTPPDREGMRREAVLPGVTMLALALVAALWAWSWLRPEARVRRASARVVQLARKDGAESPVASGLAANRFGSLLAGDIHLELNGFGTLSSGRQPTMQFFAQTRTAFEQIEFIRPVITVRTVRRGETLAVVRARYRLIADGIAPMEGEGTAELLWIRSDEGWRISRAVLHSDQVISIPGEWL